MDARTHFAGKRITVMGLGLLGRGLGDITYLAAQGADLIVTDLKTAEQLASSLEALRECKNITYVLGGHRLEDFRDCDYVLKAAGVPKSSVYIKEAEAAGIPIKMSASWFAEIAQIPLIGVTGTRGKSTTTHMLHHILEAQGKNVLLGGNVRGVSTLALLPSVETDSIALMELDSWQLQGFRDAGMSPHISIFTTFFPDHLNYYHNDLNAYLEDKAAIFLNQNEGDTLILGDQCASRVLDTYKERMRATTIVAGTSSLDGDVTLTVLGEHNRYNAALAIEAAAVLGISKKDASAALIDFDGVPGRLERVGAVDGVDYYNDTTATTPDATLAALSALSSAYRNQVILIMGGADKGLDMDALLSALPAHTKRVELLSGSGSERIKGAIPDVDVFDNLAAAVGNARRHAQPGDAIVLSPAFASFGMFSNEYDRGDQFNEIVRTLTDA